MSLIFEEAATTVNAVTEAATEATTEALSYDGYDMTLKVANSKVVLGIIGIVVLIAAIIAIIVIVNKKQKGSGFGILGGVATYLVFFYFSKSAILMAIFTFSSLKKYVVNENGISTVTNTAAYILVYTLVTGIIPIFGRWLTNKCFAYKMKTFGQNLSFGVGIACTQAVFTISTLFQMVASMVIINRSSLETLVSGATTQEELDSMMTSAMELINYKTSALVMLSIVAILLVIYQLAITVPMYALYQKKIKGTWYFMIFGRYTIIQMLEYMNERGLINELVRFIITLAIVGVTTYICYKMYVKFYKSEERDIKKEKEELRKKMQASQKKMPKFENLSNL